MKHVTFAVAAALLSCASASHATPIYGGPTYDATASTGFQSPALSIRPGSSVGDGVGVGSGVKYSAGTNVGFRAVRWEATGTPATELGNLGTDSSGSTKSHAYAVNTAGTAVGFANKFINGTDVGNRAVRWNATGTAATELGNLGTYRSGFTNCTAYAVNSAGTAVGYAYKYVAGTYKSLLAVRWNATGTAATELGSLGTDAGGATSCYAYDVNTSGTAVGQAYKYVAGTSVGLRGVRWNSTGTAATELGNLGTNSSGFTIGYARAVNDAGTAVGFMDKYIAGQSVGARAVRWSSTGTAATELGNLGTDNSGNTQSQAYAMNTAGTAVGFVDKYTAGKSVGSRAVRWDYTGTAATELGSLGTDSTGKAFSYALAVNTTGTAVGYANKYSAGTDLGERAVAWGTNGMAIDLNQLLSSSDSKLWMLNRAVGISDTNWITGVGTYDPDAEGPLVAYDRAFLIKLGYGGDADLNDKVDFSDFLVLQANFGGSGTTFSEGDFNYDGKTNFDDFLILQSTFGTTLNGSAAAISSDQVAALTAFGLSHTVPEPTALASVVLGSIAWMRRRLPSKH